MLSQWENISSGPQTRKGRKVAFLAFFSSKRPMDILTSALLSFRQQEHLFQNGLFLTPVQKLPDDKPHPLPQGIVLGSSQLGSLVSTCTFKRIWGQIQGKIFFFFFHRYGWRHKVLWVFFSFLFFLSSTTSTYNANRCLFFDRKSSSGHYGSGDWGYAHTVNSLIQTQQIKIWSFWPLEKGLGPFTVFKTIYLKR